MASQVVYFLVDLPSGFAEIAFDEEEIMHDNRCREVGPGCFRWVCKAASTLLGLATATATLLFGSEDNASPRSRHVDGGRRLEWPDGPQWGGDETIKSRAKER